MALGFLYGAGGGGSSIPEGATVLPVGDVYTLQRCAGIENPQYTTLAELLADATTLAHVIDSANATDYLVRSKTWINNQGKVPTMTSDTTPSGECFGSGIWSGAPNKWQAFDGDDSTRVGFNANVTGIIGYQFEGEPLPVKSFSILALNSNAPSYKIEGSNDGTNYTELGSYSDLSATKVFHELNNNTSYKYLRCYIPSTSSSGCYVCSLQFYGASIPLSAAAMSLIGANNYASDTLLADSDWCEAIANSPYNESVLSVIVPQMTSDTTPSGVASASQEYNNEFFAYYAFDRSATTRWMAYPASNQWVGYMFPDAEIVCKAKITTKNAWGATIKNFKIQGSNTSFTSDLVDLYSGVCQNTDDVAQEFIFTSFGSYKYYRMIATDAYSSYIGCVEIQFYGRKDV